LYYKDDDRKFVLMGTRNNRSLLEKPDWYNIADFALLLETCMQYSRSSSKQSASIRNMMDGGLDVACTAHRFLHTVMDHGPVLVLRDEKPEEKRKGRVFGISLMGRISLVWPMAS
jgi:hypothetical protein